MGLRWGTLRLAALWALFVCLQLANGSPFFGVSVQGGFQAEADVAVAARAIRLVAQSSQQSMVTFSAKLPLNTAVHSVTAGAVLQLNTIALTSIAYLTDRISWAAINKTNPPAEVFSALKTVYTDVVTSMEQAAPAAIELINSYSAANGAAIARSSNNVLLILADIYKSLSLFSSTIDTFPTPITAKEVFEKLTKSQIANIVGALDALRAELTVLAGKLKDTAMTLTDSDALISNYISMLSQAFGNIDFSLSNVFNRLSGMSADFERQLRASESTIMNDVQSFNAKITVFKDNIIAPAASQILSITRIFSEKYSASYTIIKPNVEDRLQLVKDTATDTVLNAVQNLLFTTYRVLDSAMRRIPNAPVLGKPCASKFINPYVQNLSSKMASSLTGCISSTATQVEAVLRAQLQAIGALVKDRQAYFKMWNDAINGVSSTSDVTTRTVASIKLTARTANLQLDTQGPMLTTLFSIYAQLVSNLDAILNRNKLCITLKSAELSAQLVMASTSFNTCIDS
uniref:Secreted protein n=1 Tax=Anopheles melas TaxID=34690 RepID=A0A182THM7_9DIPT